MNILIHISRILVGSLFIVSGLIKANDALGFSYKLVEYFGEKALNLTYLEPYALALAIFICVGEILLGLAVLVGAKPKLTSVLLMVMILFFTWLTFYTASCDSTDTITLVRDGVEVTETKDCVSECGCFGNAIPLTPWESFYKDVFLLFFVSIIFFASFGKGLKGIKENIWIILTLIGSALVSLIFISESGFSWAALSPLMPIGFFLIFRVFGKGLQYDQIALNDRKTDLLILPAAMILVFIFCWKMLDWYFPVVFTAILIAAYFLIKRFDSTPKGEWIIAGAATVICIIFQYYTLAHLPIQDYRPYAEGKSIRDGMKSAEELNLEPPVYATEYTFKNVNTGKDTTVLSTDYLKLYKDESFKKNYENVSWDGASLKIKDGYEPPVVDFILTDYFGEDKTGDILDNPGITFLQVAYHLEKSKMKCQSKLNDFANRAIKGGHQYFGLTSTGIEETEAFRHDYQTPFEFLIGDEKVLKTVVRANPGIVMLKDGMVIKKWSCSDLPVYDEVSQFLD